MAKQSRLSASMEDYLEAIGFIIREKQAVRAKDLAKRLQVKAASVTQALRVLAEKKLVNYSPYEVIGLTPQGEVLAEDIMARHQFLKRFFIQVLQVDQAVAEESACRMEHALAPPIRAGLECLAQYIAEQPKVWLQNYNKFRQQQKTRRPPVNEKAMNRR